MKKRKKKKQHDNAANHHIHSLPPEKMSQLLKSLQFAAFFGFGSPSGCVDLYNIEEINNNQMAVWFTL
jgi:hypothetical protein